MLFAWIPGMETQLPQQLPALLAQPQRSARFDQSALDEGIANGKIDPFLLAVVNALQNLEQAQLLKVRLVQDRGP